MKMTQEHYTELKSRVEKLKEQCEQALDFGQTLTWTIWACFHKTKIYEAFPCPQFDYTDKNIETAMKRIFNELDIHATVAA